MPDEKKTEDQKPDPVMDVLNDLQKKVEELKKPVEEKPAAPTVPTRAEQRADLQKRLGFNDDQMAAYEQDQASRQAPLVEQTAWANLSKRQDLDKYRKEIEEELSHYRPESKTPEILEKVYFMVKGRHADSAPTPAASPKPGERVASSRVSGGPGYSGTEGGASSDPKPADKSDELNEAEAIAANKLGVDHKRFALSRNSGKDITPLKRAPEVPAAANGADLELRRLQGARR